MKHRLFAGFLALFLLLPAGAAGGEEAPALRSSGSAGLPKLDKAQIVRLLDEASLEMPQDIFDSLPSCAPPYAAGAVKESLLLRAVDRLNALRRICSLPPVELSADWSRDAQYAAVLQSAGAVLSHTPSKPGDMEEDFYQLGRAASGSSNLSAGRTLLGAVDGLMDDSSPGNISTLGHRRWQLDPGLTQVGFGFVNNGRGVYRSYVAEKVFEGRANPSQLDYDFIAWPASGNFPTGLTGFTPNTPWSVTLNPGRYRLSSAAEMAQAITVTLTRQADGRTWRFSGNQYSPEARPYFHVDRVGYGVGNCIIFAPDGIDAYQGVYTVHIDGLKDAQGREVADFTYQVDFFDPEDVSAAAFPDVSPQDWFAPGVAWAVEAGVTRGTGGGFSPHSPCTRAQILTFLYRAAGQPSLPPAENPFQDVTPDDYFYRPALWAAQTGLIQGDRFAGASPCTRGEAVEYLWQLSGCPQGGAEFSFPDVPEDDPLAPAAAWAAEQGVVRGKGGLFCPRQICTRGEIVTLLFRFLGNGEGKWPL